MRGDTVKSNHYLLVFKRIEINRKAKSRKTRREYHDLVLAGHAVKRGECKLLCLYSKIFWYCGYRDPILTLFGRKLFFF